MSTVGDIQKLKELIHDLVVKQDDGTGAIYTGSGSWIFDFRAVMLVPDNLALITEVLWDTLKERDNFQIGGMESAAIPIITSLVLRAREEGKNVNGFYIRKSHKKSGLFKQIEGTLTNDPIVLVDDLVNTSGSITKQVEVLEGCGKKVSEVLTIVRFRSKDYYTYLKDKHINIIHIFTLSDFNLVLGEDTVTQNPYLRTHIYTNSKPHYRHVCPKSTPAFDGEGIYIGTDNGEFLKIDKKTRDVLWSIKTGGDTSGKNIFSSPCICNDVVFFGSYDGKVYALSTETGKAKWIFSDCEWVGSSPAVASDLNLMFIGLEHGLLGEQGSIVALDVYTGEKKWEQKSAAFTHASPLYIQEHKQVCIGGNEGILRMFDASSGELLWQFQTEGGMTYVGDSGFSSGDIKLAPAHNTVHDLIAFSSMDGWVYVLNRSDGSLKYRVSGEQKDTDYRIGVYGRPLFTATRLFFASLDKQLYCHDASTGERIWTGATSGRVFATPIIVEDRIFVGSNDGCLYEFVATTGELVSRTQFSERITNECVYDKTDSTIYIYTHGNRLYALNLIS